MRKSDEPVFIYLCVSSRLCGSDWFLRGELPPLFRDQFLVAARAEPVLAREIAVLGTDREGRRHRDVWNAEALERAPDQRLARGNRRDALAHIEMQHSAAGVFFLQLLLPFERLER